MKNLINTQSIAPPHDMIYEILKYNMSTLSGIKNHDFWMNTHVFMVTYASICEFLLFLASGSSYEMFKILALIPKIDDFW